MESGIYQIICLINGKNYIGSAINLRDRWKKHLLLLIKNKHPNKILQNSWTKYGEDYFDFNVIEYCDKESLIEREQYYLDYMKPEFNIAKIAGSQLGIKRSKEYCEKMSFLGKGRKASQEACYNMSKAKIGNTSGKYTKGYIHPKRKFSAEDIKDIRINKLTIAENAKEYSSDYATIKNIRKYITYRELP